MAGLEYVPNSLGTFSKHSSDGPFTWSPKSIPCSVYTTCICVYLNSPSSPSPVCYANLPPFLRVCSCCYTSAGRPPPAHTCRCSSC